MQRRRWIIITLKEVHVEVEVEEEREGGVNFEVQFDNDT